MSAGAELPEERSDRNFDGHIVDKEAEEQIKL